MGTITVSLPDEVEEKLRRYAYAKYGKVKGALSRFIAHLIEVYEETRTSTVLELLDEYSGNYGRWEFDRERLWRRGE